MTGYVRSSLTGASLALALGCSSGAPPWPSPAEEAGGAGAEAPASPAGSGNTGATPGPGASSGAGGVSAGGASATGVNEGPPGASLDPPPPRDASAPPGPACEQQLVADVEAPTVLVLADRSGSMFSPLDAAPLDEPAPAPRSVWSELRATVLAAIEALESDVRFGFLAYSGDGEVCPELTSLAPALGNHAAIAALYGSLEAPERRNGAPPLAEAASLLALAGGDARVWLVTDGDVDYCDDGNPLCPVDSAIAALQRLAAANPPIRTTVFGATPLGASALSSSALQAFANAGAGEPVSLPALGPNPTDPNAIFDQCSGVPAWADDFARTGKPAARGQSAADYAAAGGAALVRGPLGPGDGGELVAALRRELANERRCAFDLAAAGVAREALATLDEAARLELGGAVVPHDTVDGWHLVGDATLRLEGASCEAVRAAPATPTLRLTWACDP